MLNKKKTHGNRKKKWDRLMGFLLVFVLTAMSCPAEGIQAAKTKPASKPAAHTATLRIISTTDLHGQVTTTHYDTASEKPGSLAQAYTLIKEARQEVGSRNTMTVDTGDSVYGYAADYILEHSGEDTVQPIYKAMELINYDAITLGNHDFDYGYQYIDKQLELSGLKNKCVVSNIILGDTGETAWNETKFITKKVKTNKNKYVNVNIGIIGVTIPSMSSYSNCKADLIPQPIVSTVEKQAADLKSQGVDLVVVVAHSSFGNANPESMADNAVYALTKLKNVDAIAAGHGHKNYPSTDTASAVYYRLPNVDKKTGLMNGKAVTMIKDHGAGIGVIDLTLEIDSEGEIKLSGASAELRMVTEDTPSSPAIIEVQKPEINTVDESMADVVATIAGNEKINSYFALLEDNYAIQLVNESKIQHGLAYTGGAGKNLYADCPVVAMTKYTLSNSNSANDNISLDGTITMKDILNMQQDNHNNNIVYWASAGQLRELLEWSASVYSKADGTISSDEELEKQLKAHGASSIVSPDWLNDWSSFAVFDGIHYTIDATRSPRYSKSGELIDSYAHRIVEMSYNGQPLADDATIVLVSHTMPNNVDAAGTISTQKLLGKTDLAYEHLIKYIKQEQEFGDLIVDTDNNWEVQFDSSRNYIVRSSVLSQQDAAVKEWFNGLVSTNETFAYYLAQFIEAGEGTDNTKPMLVISQTVTEETDQTVDVKVQATDESGIQQLKWAKGRETADSSIWEQAGNIARGIFPAEENGIYSVMAEDSFGNRTVKYVNITNINPDTVLAPTINKVSNKSSVVSGTARYGTTVHINADGNTYEVMALEDGTYTCTVERMATGKTVTAYCMDENGKRSKDVSVTVFKNGPDFPVVNEVTNKSENITGHFTDYSTTVVALIGSDVYVPEADKGLYQKSELYSKSRTVHTVNFALSRNNFELSVPTQDAGQQIKMISLDKAGRKSATVAIETAGVAPDIPVIYETCDVENYLYGKVTNVSEGGTVSVAIGSREYTGEIQADGSFSVQTDGQGAGEVVVVTAKDTKDGVPRSSASASSIVQPYENYLKAENTTSLQSIYDNSTQITGNTTPGYDLYVVVRGKGVQVIPDSYGQFTYALTEPLQAGEKVYAVARSGGKIAETAVQTVESDIPQVVIPQSPAVLTGDITLETQQIEVLAYGVGTVVMEIDGVEYTSQASVYNQAYNGYVYTLQLPQAYMEQVITIRYVDASGVSSSPVTVMRTNNV